MKLKFIIILACYMIAFNVYSAEQIVKEEVTPPPAESAITIDQLPPVLLSKPNASLLESKQATPISP